jgi:hypothetical protein
MLQGENGLIMFYSSVVWMVVGKIISISITFVTPELLEYYSLFSFFLPSVTIKAENEKINSLMKSDSLRFISFDRN